MTKTEFSMKELAERSGLSLSSISRALDPARAHLVKPKTREVIAQHVREMNYSVNLAARRLKINRTETITVVALRDPFRSKVFSPEFISHTINPSDLQEVSLALRARHYDMKLEYIDTEQPLDPSVFDRHRTDGVLFVAYHGTDYCDILRRNRLPAVYMSRYIDVNRTDVPLVGLNREPGFRSAVGELMRQGRSRIGWIGTLRNQTLRINCDILLRLLTQNGCLDESLFFDVCSYYDIRRLLAEGIASRVDALFCRNDVVADWVIRELRFIGVRVPEDIAVIGYDNDPAFRHADRSSPATVGVERGVMPEMALNMLIDLVEQPEENEQSIRRMVAETVFKKGKTV